MKKSIYENRNFVELVEFLKTERTRRDDTITFKVQYPTKNGRPQIFLLFETYNEDLKIYKAEEEVTDWLPETSNYEPKDDRGREVPGVYTVGYNSWKDSIRLAFAPVVKAIVEVGGRRFLFEEEEIE